MNLETGRLDAHMAAAYVRGAFLRGKIGEPPAFAVEKTLESLTEDEIMQLIAIGKRENLKIHYFKSMEQLPRVRAAMGFLRGIGVQSLLDVGSGRGAFLFPFLKEFPYIPVTSVDLLERRIEVLRDLQSGGYECLTPVLGDLLQLDAPDRSFDAVTMLEVLEHIPDSLSAAKAAVRLAKRYVVLTVPSKPDNNPEHIHLFTKDSLTDIFMRAGAKKLHFDGVPGHIFMTAAV